MPMNVRYAIKDTSITNLDEAIDKAYVIEENMVKSNVDKEMILGKFQRQMATLSINPQWSPTSRSGEILGTERGLFYVNPPNTTNALESTQSWRYEEIAKLNNALHQMKNEFIVLTRGDDYNIRNLSPPQGVEAPNLGFRNKTKVNKWKENKQNSIRAPQQHVPNVVIMDDPIKEENDLEINTKENESLSR